MGCQIHILDDNHEEQPVGETGGIYFEGGPKFEYLHDDEKFGKEVKAVVQPVDMSAAGAVLEAELIEYARARISHIKCPRSIDFVEVLPRRPTSKLYKRLLKDKYWEQHSSS